MTHSAAKPKEANDAGRHTGPSPIRDRTSASADAANPRLLDAIANEYFAGPSGRLFAWNATYRTDNPTMEATVKPNNATTRRHVGGTKRGFERNHRAQPQISEGIGSRYPAIPTRIKKPLITFLPPAIEVSPRKARLTTG
jgi:hypothetical protein